MAALCLPYPYLIMKLHRVLVLISIVVTVAGLAGLAPYVYFWHKNQAAITGAESAITIPSQAPLPEQTPELIVGKPTRLHIPSLDIDLNVVDGSYDANTHSWTLSTDKAHYALPSMQPNNAHGNTLIYGHNRKEVFARLPNIAPGAKAYVTTSNGYKFTYEYNSSKTVDPTNVDIFAYEGAPQLTVQTCTGTWFQNRQLFTFRLVGAVEV